MYTYMYVYTYMYMMLSEMQKERKKERHLRQWKNENESCLRWDMNPRQSVLQKDALPTELPRQLSWQGPNQTSHTPV